ncbi:hypothetical protein SAMD00019534_007100 [Acytostelium subglobosum LB1]|uniref:hypothetical protein n=1 Tax=Acytostelium subglobosum LB1 TaxID=1410327 RepID=UPI000644AA48|nr:hypothetical protein SAMD00019534_007100 [Acytostelium subglobosum LB1]GAM17535.1 hypothetical protein SAMD00019534_007100 [Acytostelium subglobosum LB1]|eukprot:XP_012759597.1 hypothetical protein SAMD00019534_007100 [Acytostelium subglobosum LB1]
MLPKTLVHLTIAGDVITGRLDNVLPVGLKTLDLGLSKWNHPITPGTLPSKLDTIIFGQYFNQPLSRSNLPESLTRLELNMAFNHPLDRDTLPPSLLQLVFQGSVYRHPLPNLPTTVTKLSMPNYNNHVIGMSDTTLYSRPNIFPHLKELLFAEMPYSSLAAIISYSFPSLEELKIEKFKETRPLEENDLSTLPSTLRSLHIAPNGPITSFAHTPLDNLFINCGRSRDTFTLESSQIWPSSLLSLSLIDYNIPILPGDLPPSITSLHIHAFHYHIQPESLPPTLRSLNLTYCTNVDEFLHQIPKSVVKLESHTFYKEYCFKLLRISETVFLRINYNDITTCEFVVIDNIRRAQFIKNIGH